MGRARQGEPSDKKGGRCTHHANQEKGYTAAQNSFGFFGLIKDEVKIYKIVETYMIIRTYSLELELSPTFCKWQCGQSNLSQV